jgi:hypothetical protein
MASRQKLGRMPADDFQSDIDALYLVQYHVETALGFRSARQSAWRARWRKPLCLRKLCLGSRRRCLRLVDLPRLDAESQEYVETIASLKNLPNLNVGEFQNERCFASHSLSIPTRRAQRFGPSNLQFFSQLGRMTVITMIEHVK